MTRYTLFTLLLSTSILTPLCSMQQVNLGWDGALYDQASDRQFSAGKMLLEKLKEMGLESSAAVLELGCGTGRLAKEIAVNVVPNGAVYGVDNNKSMIDEAERKQKEQPIENLNFNLQDARTLSFEDEMFDACISVFCLHWIYTLDNMRLALQNIARTLKPGGKFVAIFNIPDSQEHPFLLQRAARALIHSDKWSKFYTGDYSEMHVLGNEITLEQYRNLLTEVGIAGKVMVQNVGICNMTKEERIKSFSILPAFKAVIRDLEKEQDLYAQQDVGLELLLETEHKLDDRKSDFISDIFTEFDKLGMRNEDGTYKQCTPVGMIIAQKPIK